MKTLVTGSLGYIAPNLLKMIPDAVGYDIKDDQHPLWMIFESIDTVYHLGALSGIKACEDNPRDAIKYNITETQNLINHYKGAKFIFTSSEAVEHPDNLYARTKLIGESLILKTGGIVCRLSNVYGGNNYLKKKDTVIARLIKGTFEERHQDDVSRDFIHVSEVCKGLIYASTQPNGVYSLNTGVRTSLKELKEMVKSPHFPEQLIRPYKLTRLQ